MALDSRFSFPSRLVQQLSCCLDMSQTKLVDSICRNPVCHRSCQEELMAAKLLVMTLHWMIRILRKEFQLRMRNIYKNDILVKSTMGKTIKVCIA